METIETAVEPEPRITGARIIARNNYTQRGSQHIVVSPRSIATQVDVAMMLDLTSDEATSRRGYSGTGAGANLELVFGGGDPADDEEENVEEVYSIDHPAIRALPVGSVWHLNRFIARQGRRTMWNGNNHVRCSATFSHELRDRIRGR